MRAGLRAEKKVGVYAATVPAGDPSYIVTVCGLSTGATKPGSTHLFNLHLLSAACSYKPQRQ